MARRSTVERPAPQRSSHDSFGRVMLLLSGRREVGIIPFSMITGLFSRETVRGVAKAGTHIGGENAVTAFSPQSVPVFSRGLSNKHSLRFHWVPTFSKTRGQVTIIGGLPARPSA